MRVLLFIHSLGAGGAERVSAHLANYWTRHGFRVTVVTLAPRDEDRYELDPGVERVSLGRVGPSKGMWGGLRANARRVKDLRRVLAEQKPDVAVSMMSSSNVLLALAAVGLGGIRTFGSERVHPPLAPLGRAWEFMRARSYGLLDGVVAQTARTREWILAHTSARLVAVIPNPVVWPMERRGPLVRPGSFGVKDRKRILAVGRLEYQKGFDILLGVFSSLVPDFPEWELAIVGVGSKRADLESTIQTLELGERAFLVGEVGNIGDWYESAGVFVLSSRFEGFPNALAEAMAQGVAVVSFDCDTGPGDLIRDGLDGLLVPDGDAGALRAALAQLMRDDVMRARLAARSIGVRDRFALNTVGEMWLDLFRARSP